MKVFKNLSKKKLQLVLFGK